LARACSSVAGSAPIHWPMRSRRSDGLVTAVTTPATVAPGTSGVACQSVTAALMEAASRARVSSLERLAPMELFLSSP